MQMRSEHRGTMLLKRKVDSLALELHPQGRRIKYQESKIKDLELIWEAQKIFYSCLHNNSDRQSNVG